MGSGGVGVEKLESGGLEWARVGSGGGWGRRGWSWIRRGSSQEVGVKEVRGVGGLGSKGLEEFGSGRPEGLGSGLGSGGWGVGSEVWVGEVGSGFEFGRLGSGGLGSGVGFGRLGSGELESGGGLGLGKLMGIRRVVVGGGAVGVEKLESGVLEWGRRGWGWVGGVGVGGDGVGFEGVQVRRLGSRRSEELGSKGLEMGSEEFGSRGRVAIREVGEVGVWVRG